MGNEMFLNAEGGGQGLCRVLINRSLSATTILPSSIVLERLFPFSLFFFVVVFFVS